MCGEPRVRAHAASHEVGAPTHRCGLRASLLAGTASSVRAYLLSARLASGIASRIKKGSSKFRDGREERPPRSASREVQRLSSNDPRRRIEEPALNGAPSGLALMTFANRQFPQERDRDAKKARAAQGEEPNQPHDRAGVSRARFSPCRGYGPAGEQKHLPDRFDTTAARVALQRLSTTLYERKMKHDQEGN